MNPIFIKLILDQVNKQKKDEYNQPYNHYLLAKKIIILKKELKRFLKDVILIVLSVFLAAFGFKGFLLTNQFIDGGATGISLLLSFITQLPLYVFIILVNIPFIILAYKVMGKNFAIRSAFSISLLSFILAVVPFPNVTDDNILVSIFGGFFLGAGIGFAIRGGTVIDGTEILAIYLSKKFGSTIGDVITIINVVIFSFAAYFLGVDKALYSMITYLSASKTLDFIVEGFDEYLGMTIISNHSNEIKEMLITKLNKSVTIYKGQKGLNQSHIHQEIDIIYTVITRLEINKINSEIEKIDPNAFIVMDRIKDIKGGVLKRKMISK
ncbi:MAG: YitT family protein [Bacteroidia bacterium]